MKLARRHKKWDGLASVFTVSDFPDQNISALRNQLAMCFYGANSVGESFFRKMMMKKFTCLGQSRNEKKNWTIFIGKSCHDLHTQCLSLLAFSQQALDNKNWSKTDIFWVLRYFHGKSIRNSSNLIPISIFLCTKFYWKCKNFYSELGN